MKCKSGDGCGRDAVPKRRFCSEHAEVLDRVKAELLADSRARRGRTRPPRCLRQGCDRARHPHSVLCARHLNVEDEAPPRRGPAKHDRGELAEKLAGIVGEHGAPMTRKAVSEAAGIDRDSSTATRALKLAVERGLLGRAGALYAPQGSSEAA